MVLFRQLESVASRDQVVRALQHLLGQPRAISVDDVEAELTATTGLDLTAYFAGWVRGTGTPTWPRIAATWTAGTGGAGTLTITQTNLTGASGKGCVFAIALRGAGGEEVRVPVDTLRGGPAQTVPVTGVGFAVTSTVLDPDAQCLVYPVTATAGPVRDRPHGGW
jgi:aminopeptidase N